MKNWRQPNCPLTGKWVKFLILIQWNICTQWNTQEQIKITGLELPVSWWINLKNMVEENEVVA